MVRKTWSYHRCTVTERLYNYLKRSVIVVYMLCAKYFVLIYLLSCRYCNHNIGLKCSVRLVGCLKWLRFFLWTPVVNPAEMHQLLKCRVCSAEFSWGQKCMNPTMWLVLSVSIDHATWTPSPSSWSTVNAAVDIVQFNSRDLQIKENLLFIIVSTFNSRGNAMQCSSIALLSGFT